MALFFSHLLNRGSGDLDLVIDKEHTFEVAHEFLRNLFDVIRGDCAVQIQYATFGLKLAAHSAQSPIAASLQSALAGQSNRANAHGGAVRIKAGVVGRGHDVDSLVTGE